MSIFRFLNVAWTKQVILKYHAQVLFDATEIQQSTDVHSHQSPLQVVSWIDENLQTAGSVRLIPHP